MITIDDFVQREVIYCISSLVHELAQEEKYMDELTPVLVQDDWESAARDEGWQVANYNSPIEFIKKEGNSFSRPKYYEDWRHLCENNDIEPQQTEAYEHWIITGWLADKLEAKGEMIIRDFLGIGAIWGRSCTGQAISLDNVIQEIYRENISQERKMKAAAAALDKLIE